ncbi:Slc38a10, partial [Symbiodinium necroappetens]
ASANFVASLHANYVVNLDFDSSTTEAAGLDNLDDEDVKVMNLANGRRKFRCRLPGGRNISQQLPGAPDAKAHFLAAKLAPWRGSCLTVIKDFWSYDLCSGSKVVQYRDDAGMRFSLGEHHPKSDRLLPTGEVRELYLGGTDNRSTEVRYVCGRGDTSATSLEVVEDPVHFYTLTVSGPAFCSWKDRDGAEAGMGLAWRLEPLRSRCLNISRGWWTYEYCYPANLVQFHLENDKRAPQYTLGTLEGTAQSKSPNRVNMSMIRLKPSMSPRERRAPPSRHLTLEQQLGGGNETWLDFADLLPCAKGKSGILIKFVKELQMHGQRPESRIVSVTESSLCEYEVLIHTTLLCGHHKLMPTLPRGKETIQCVADPRDEEPAKMPRSETLTQMDKPEVSEMKKAMEMLEPASKVPAVTSLPFENPYSMLLKLSLAERVQGQKPELLEALMCISKALAIGPACQELWWSAAKVFLQLFLQQDDADSLVEPWSQKLQVLAGSSDTKSSPCWRFLYGQARMLNQVWQCRLTRDLNSGLQKTLKAGHRQIPGELSHLALQWFERQLEMLVLLRCRRRYFARNNESRLVSHLNRCKRTAQTLLWFLIKCTDMSGEFHYTADVMATVKEWDKPVFAETWCRLANGGSQPLLCFRGMDGRDRVPATYLWYVPYILGRIEWKLSKLCPASPERLERKSIICLLMDACHVELAVRASLTERRRDEIMETEPSFRLHAVRLAILFGSPDGYESAGTICFDTNCLELSRQNVIVDALKGMQAVVQENKCHMGKYLSCEARALLDSGELNRAADCVIKIVDEAMRARKFRVPSFGACLNPHVMLYQRARKAERQQWAAMQTCTAWKSSKPSCRLSWEFRRMRLCRKSWEHSLVSQSQQQTCWVSKRQLVQPAQPTSRATRLTAMYRSKGEEEPTSSICGCALSLVSTCVGSGLLALPFAFAAAGPLHGLGLLAGSAILSAFVSLLLCMCCDWSEKKSYEELAIAAFGSWGSVIMELMVVWLLLGAMTSLLVIAGDCLMAVGPSLDLAGSERRGLLTALDVALVILPLSCLQSPASLLYSNAIAVSCTLLVGLLLSLRSWGAWGSLSDMVISNKSNLSGLPGLLRAVPIVTLSLGCQVQVPCIYATLEKRSFKRMRCAILAAMGLCIFIYTVVALSGLHIAELQGVTAVPGNVLDLFGSSDWLGGAMRAAISVAVTLAFPMLCLPCRSTVDHLVFGGGAFAASNAGMRHRMETLVVVGITLLLSTTESDLSKVFGFTGATAGAVICYVLPLCFYLRLRKMRPAVERRSTIAVAVLCGLLLAAMIPCVALATWQLL